MNKAFNKFAKKDARNLSRAEELNKIVKESFEGMDFGDMDENEDAEGGMEGDADAMDLDAAIKELENLPESDMSLEEDDDKGFSDAEIDAWLNELHENDSEGGEESEEGEELHEEDESDLEKEVEKMLAKLKSDAGSAGKEEGSMEEEYEGLMDEAEELEDSIADDIMAEIKKVYETEMEESMSVSYQNEKGMNKKPEDYDYKDMYLESVKRARKLAKENRELKAQISETRNSLTKLDEGASRLAVYNDNLVNIVNLFMENALTKKEKEAIVEKFGSKDPKTPNESKALYEAIQKGIKKRDEALLKESKSKVSGLGGQKSIVSEGKETKAYADPAMLRAIQLINYKSKK